LTKVLLVTKCATVPGERFAGCSGVDIVVRRARRPELEASAREFFFGREMAERVGEL
jgi:hypothetical protein